ncbi:hypothetical protein HED60_03820 [Planctomycetales bacterium ZRK34]|nr:hypothetical protein HED60_03820 [Planctomycetales bacterium ZRK34]
MIRPSQWYRGMLSSVLLLGVGAFSAVSAAEPSMDVQSEIKALKAEVARLRAKDDESWLTERRAEEVKTLIREVLSDADTRASLAEGGVTAGHNGKNFYLASEDGSFLMIVGGQIQMRYVHNFDTAGTGSAAGPDSEDFDDDDGGFQVRRSKLKFKGHVDAGRKWTYEIVLAGKRDDGLVEMEDAIIGTEIADGWDIEFGKFKMPFLRTELVSSSKQLAVDRAIVTEFFTIDRSEQIQLNYQGEMFRGSVSLNDGADSEFTIIGSDAAEVGVAARGEILLAGSWKSTGDFTAWSKEEDLVASLGGAIFYQVGDGYNADNSSESEANYFAWTVDGLIKVKPFSITAAFMGGHTELDGTPDPGDDDVLTNVANRDMYGAMVQAGVFLIPDKLQPFVRYEWLDPDNNDTDGLDDKAMFLTFGANYYFKGHAAKFTGDVIWVMDLEDSIVSNPWGNSPFSDGLGFSGDGVEEDTLVARLQFQLLF